MAIGGGMRMRSPTTGGFVGSAAGDATAISNGTIFNLFRRTHMVNGTYVHFLRQSIASYHSSADADLRHFRERERIGKASAALDHASFYRWTAAGLTGLLGASILIVLALI
jgi:hypothetical protein